MLNKIDSRFRLHQNLRRAFIHRIYVCGGGQLYYSGVAFIRVENSKPPAVFFIYAHRHSDLPEFFHPSLYRRLPLVSGGFRTWALRPHHGLFHALRQTASHAVIAILHVDWFLHLASGKYRHAYRHLALPQSNRRVVVSACQQMERLGVVGGDDIHHRGEPQTH